jgi:hypothetical protein
VTGRALQSDSWRRGIAIAVAPLLAALVVGACGQTIEVGFDEVPSSGGRATAGSTGAGGTPSAGGVGAGGSLDLGGFAGGGSTAGAAPLGGAAACVETACGKRTYLCGNCLDDDDDGLIDSLDPDCLGPCDDDELGLSAGLTKSSAACRQDCYFDGDNGSGNDKCLWSHACDPLSVAPAYPPSGDAKCKYGADMGVECDELHAAQASTCLEACLPLVPNGCDCFGCCELPGGSGDYHFIGIGAGEAGCQRDNLDDPTSCPPCTPVTSCFNDCGKCETCVGKLPDPSCTPGSSCPGGGRACAADAPCDFGDYCVTGCCVRAPEPI